MNPFISVDFTDKYCIECKKKFNEDNYGVYLQCECSIHSNCIKKLCLNKFGDEMSIWTIDKRKLFNAIEQVEQNEQDKDNDKYNKIFNRNDKDSYNIMCFGTEETNGVIICPKCELAYSILSPIYRDFDIPKLIQSIVMFLDNDEKEMLYYYICSSLDSIHLFSYSKQKNLLEEFDYQEENKFIDMYKTQNETKNLSQKHKFYHAVIIQKQIFVLYGESECPVCNNKFIDNNEYYKHSTINDYMKYLQHNYMCNKYLFDTSEEYETSTEECENCETSNEEYESSNEEYETSNEEYENCETLSDE